MANDSTVAGFLTPLTNPVYGDPLDDILHDTIVGVTGLPGDMVRPRWQPEPPTSPPFTTDWCAFGVVRSVVDTNSYVKHDPTGSGSSMVDRDEMLYVLHSFYGPNCHSNCEVFRDGLELGQNRDALLAQGIVIVEVEEAVILPELLKEKWVKRLDATVTYRRRTSRLYAIRTITSSHIDLDNEYYVTPINS